MARVSYRSDISSHPDVSEMRDRYDRMMGGRDVALVDAPVFLLGLYFAVSPWIIHFSSVQTSLSTHNLIIGIAISLLAIGFTAAPQRMYGLSWAMGVMGIWMIISPWVVGRNSDGGVIANNVVVGALTLIMGLVCAVTARGARNKT
ncbi:SPW repeat protein [Streptomyces poonensis]|uniref:Membrane protein n=1 Tax=Streptomyces poonensis TaxID=68255 RepID=A0A918PDS6_9ACTN|nr:SPW repeat protein [Streptomyces poonensis]GGZ00776.1 membrane protein [Streptomyces poonensis]GLJ90437.1 membrane protein [Streptomyces poonensis]